MRLYQSGWDAGAVDLVADLFDEPDPWIRGMGYFVHSQVAINFGLLDGVDADLREAVRNFRESGDRWGLSFTLMAQADLLGWRGEHAAAAGLYEEALDLNERVGGALGMFIQVHSKFARQLYILGERDRAKDLLAEALREAERMSAPEVLASIHQQFGEFAWRDGDRAEATRRFDRAEELAPEGSGPPQFRAVVLASRAQVDADWGDLDAARARLEEALCGAVRALDYPIVALVLIGHATVALAEGRMERAAELIGTADALRGIRDQTQPQIAKAETAARDALGEAAFTAAYERGLAQSFDDVLADFGLEHPAPAGPGDL
jgi:tetratricopeptide (TPR) repeat protein